MFYAIRLLLLALWFTPFSLATAQSLGLPASKAEEKALRAAVIKNIVTECFRLDSPELKKVFDGKFFAVKTGMRQGTGTSGMGTQIISQSKGKGLFLDDTTTTQPCPVVTKLVKKSFKLKTKADCQVLAAALASLYDPGKYISDDDKKLRQNLQDGSTWTIVRGKFFKDGKGFVVKTDKSGSVTDVSYSLRIKLKK